MSSMFPVTPNMNPTGAIGWGGVTPPANAIGPSGVTPPSSTGGAGSYNFGNSMNPQPSQMSGGGAMASSSAPSPVNSNPGSGNVPSTGSTTPVMNPGTTGTNTGQNQFASPNTPQGQSESQWELEQTYGVGVGSMLYDFLQSGGGFNSAITNQAVTEQEAAMQQAIQRGWGNIASNEAETGISPNSSTSALTQGDYYSNAVTQENAMISQEFYNMWNQSMSNETSILGQVAQGSGTWKANQGDTWKTILGAGAELGAGYLSGASWT